MKRRTITWGAVAFLCAGTLSSAQIAPQGGVQQRPPQPSPSASAQQPKTSSEGPAMTLAGCLYREESIPGRSPNVAEKAGINRDFILADATMAPSTSTPGQAAPGQAGGPTAGLASGRMYKVMKIDEDRLKTLVGKRVEVMGSIKPDNDAKPGDRTNNQNLPNIEATSIREVAGATCPSTPASESATPSATSPSRPSTPTTPTTPSPRPTPDPTSPRTPDTTNPTNPGNPGADPGNPGNPRPDTNR